MNNKIYYEFNKNDNLWNECIFYTIYLNDKKEKCILIRGLTNRIYSNNSYNLWGYKDLSRLKIKEKLSKLLEWGDINYGISTYKKEHGINRMLDNFEDENIDIYNFPEYAYEFANKMVKGIDNNGSKNLHIIEIRENTPCGNYFGMGII